MIAVLLSSCRVVGGLIDAMVLTISAAVAHKRRRRSERKSAEGGLRGGEKASPGVDSRATGKRCRQREQSHLEKQGHQGGVADNAGAYTGSCIQG